jgi:hypothetical protein
MPFLKYGNIFKVTSTAALDLHENLPNNTYVVKFNQLTNEYYLEQIESFSFSGKVYGDCEKMRDRILGTFDSRDRTTGVLLIGEKGSGKSLLAKLISIEATKRGMPTIVINSPFFGETFNAFMQGITQRTVIIFDEFEKVYRNEYTGRDEDNAQEQVLTLLDGVYPSKKLFLFTCNHPRLLNSLLNNRPGRIYYRLEFSSLTEEFVVEYCSEKLTNKQHIGRIKTIYKLFSSFNFDMLQALVEEMNRYNESPDEVLKYLNLKVGDDSWNSYLVQLFINDVQVPSENVSNNEYSANILNDGARIYYTDDAGESNSCHFAVHSLTDIDLSNGKYTFVVGNKKLIMTRFQRSMLDVFKMV